MSHILLILSAKDEVLMQQRWNRRQALAGLAFALDLPAQRQTFMTTDYIDAHVHVWKPADALFPYDPHYSGPAAAPITFTPENLLAITETVAVKRIVLVQMSFYGTDNSYMLDAMKRHRSVFSGIAVVDEDAASLAVEMARLASLGVRGFRITQGNRPAGWLETANMREMWHLAAEMKLAICPLVGPDAIPALDRMCAEFTGTTLVIDHMARIGMDGKLRNQDVSSLCKLSRHLRVHVKVSAFYALGKKQSPYSDLAPLVHALYDAYGPRRLMWGSDSPFQVQPPYTYAESLEFVRNRLPFLSLEDKEWILRKSAEMVFF
jgi:predicted TIM-barrel fold metal-dependent hydrolase